MTVFDEVLTAVYRRDFRGLDRLTPADLKATDADGRTALMHAVLAENADAAIVRRLIERGADPGTADAGQKWTALHFAARDQKEPVVRALLEGAARVDAGDLFGNTPLMRSFEGTVNPRVVELLDCPWRRSRHMKKNSPCFTCRLCRQSRMLRSFGVDQASLIAARWRNAQHGGEKGVATKSPSSAALCRAPTWVPAGCEYGRGGDALRRSAASDGVDRPTASFVPRLRALKHRYEGSYLSIIGVDLAVRTVRFSETPSTITASGEGGVFDEQRSAGNPPEAAHSRACGGFPRCRAGHADTSGSDARASIGGAMPCRREAKLG